MPWLFGCHAIPVSRSPWRATSSALDLDGFFGFHPSLASLKPLFDARHLAVIHAAGSPDSTRSHFDAQDYMESATPGLKSTEDGWLNRYLQTRPEAPTTPFRAVAFAPRLPRTLQGQAAALAMDDLRGFRLQAGLRAGLAPAARLGDTFQAMYASASDPLLSHAAQETFDAISTLEHVGIQDYRPTEPSTRRGRSAAASSRWRNLLRPASVSKWHLPRSAAGTTTSTRAASMGSSLQA